MPFQIAMMPVEKGNLPTEEAIFPLFIRNME